MAYTSQETDWARETVLCVQGLLGKMDEWLALKQRNTSQSIITGADADVNLFNGVKGSDLSGVITSMNAIQTLLEVNTNYHLNASNKVR